MLPTLVINLARSKERWTKLAESGRGTGLEVRRVPAIDGAAVPEGLRGDLDAAKFRANHGRQVLAGEYGCYQSHLSALQTIVDEGYELAIIAEDDIRLNSDLEKRVEAIFRTSPSIDLLKLVNHRTTGFIRYGISALGDEFGRCIHGPQGSAACYAVTQQGARRLLVALKPMWLPYDLALERGWSTGVSTFTTRVPFVAFEEVTRADTTIATRTQYREVKLPKFKRWSVLKFRFGDYVSRIAYGLKRP
ncbi:glycosyltransferase family 25 protein [Pseudaminobacter sp. NGMCC 1.201702]|uniref:glycosyltransferase family 25 protein n=1 Tax=Pseudaminobacter sp. NGMCC 1.201702 TaxID=3391825 RepID=UPI0039F1263D